MLRQGLALGITREGQGRQASQEPLDPPNVMTANGEQDIVDLDS
jgi:hypothetical protein